MPWLVFAIGSMIWSAYQSIQAGRQAARAGAAAQASAESEAQLADYNAAVADLQAQDATTRGAQAEARFRQDVEGMIGAQRAGFAGANIDVAVGSALDVQADAAYLGELDALQIRTNAAREAWGYKVQAEDLRKRAAIARTEGVYHREAGRAEARGAYGQVVGGVLSGSASLLLQRYGFDRGTRATTTRPVGGPSARLLDDRTFGSPSA